MSVLSSAGQKGLSRKRGAGVPGGKRAEYMRVDQGVESRRKDQEGGGREGVMSKRRQGQKEGDKTKKKRMETEGEDKERKGRGNKKKGRVRKNATVPGNRRRDEE
jgi:hypothetical protein